MTQILGWLAVVASLSGHVLAAKGDRRGWAVRIGAGGFWLWFGILNGATQYIAISCAYLAIDAYGWSRRRRKKPGLVDAATARRLVNDDRHPLLTIN